MLQLTLRGLVAHKRRLLSTMIAVVLGVSFMAGSQILTDTMKSSLAGSYVDSERATDVQVRGGVVFDGDNGAVRANLPAALGSAIAKVPGVAAVAPRIEAYASVTGRNGKPVGDLNNGAAPVGSAWTADAELNPYHLVAGHAPQGDDEVVIDKHTASIGHLRVGSSTTVLTTAAPHRVRVVGIAKFGRADSMAGTSSVLFTPAAARSYLTPDGTVSSFAVRAAHGIGQAQLAERIRAGLPAKAEAVTGAVLTKENAQRKNSDVDFFGLFITVFAIVSLLVGAFIINNTFAIVVAQRVKELALVRALGASRKQVRRSVALEALVVGVVSSAVGLVGGVAVARGLQRMMSAFSISLPEGPLEIRSSSLTVAFVVGVVVTVVSALLPARRAARVAPVAAMRDVAVEAKRSGIRRTATGTVLAGAGATGVVGGVLAGQMMPVLLGALGAVLGVAVLAPVIATPAVRLLGVWLPSTRGMRGVLARENAVRNPRRTSATAAALMVGVSLVGAITTFVASGKWSVQTSFDREYRGDVVVDSGAFMYGGFSPSLVQSLKAQPEVGTVSAKRYASVALGGTPTELAAWDTSTLSSVFDLGTSTGVVTHLGPDSIAISSKMAKDRSLKIGDRVPAAFGSGSSRVLTVSGIYKHLDWVGGAFVDSSVFTRNLPSALDVQVGVKAAPGVSVSALEAAVQKVASPYATAEVRDRQQVRAAVVKSFNTALAFVYGLLALAVLIALMGIANTISLSVVERTREIGVLRAVGMSRSHVRAMVRWEAALVGAFGAVMGVAVGMFLGWSLVFAVSRTVETAKFVVPWAQLAVIVAVAAACGVVAALLPARRAARQDVLAAIASS